MFVCMCNRCEYLTKKMYAQAILIRKNKVFTKRKIMTFLLVEMKLKL